MHVESVLRVAGFSVSVLLRLFLKYDETVSEFAFEFNLRPYIEDGVVHANQATSQFKGVRWDKSSGK